MCNHEDGEMFPQNVGILLQGHNIKKQYALWHLSVSKK